ncbi:hypothetical protein FB45DRAFT_1123077 [Roridomyces roridus]|uniref:DUF6532 domain-containing protein n=1 Tax=Roridomyces roridus TaxID=1738132 RepID=A0AAD7B4L6_9AGAR|nr:hypothetical protein FB45DRAFT_1123077 [Roridomyces roridus]
MYDSEADEPPAQTVKPKPRRRSRDDLSGNVTLTDRTRGTARKPSERQAVADKENAAAATQKLQAAQKKIAKMEKKMKEMEKSGGVPTAQAEDDDDFESEERDDESDGVFASRITPLPLLPVPLPRPTPVIRKVQSSQSTTHFSPRTFKSLPEPATAQRPGGSTINVSTLAPDHNDEGTNGMDIEEDDIDPVPVRYAPAPARAAPLPAVAACLQPTTGDKRVRAAAVDDTSAPPAKRSTKPKLRESKYREDFVAGPKPKAGDYEPVVEALILRACGEYSARILTLNPFPSTAFQLQWAQQCWDNANIAADEALAEGERPVRYQVTERIKKIIGKRGSHIRGKVVESLRPLFAAHFKLKRSSQRGVIITNKIRITHLIDYSAFHYKDFVVCQGFGGAAILGSARGHYVFRDKNSLAIIFRSYFYPLPPPFIALEFTVLQHLGDEWSTGSPIVKKFTEKDNTKIFLTHLNDVKKWCEASPEVTTKIRTKWYNRAAQSIGPQPLAAVNTNISWTQMKFLHAELEGRTGETDSEAEESLDEDEEGEDDADGFNAGDEDGSNAGDENNSNAGDENPTP